MHDQNSHEVRTEKLIKKPVGEVFRALSEGLLFMNCGADSESIKLDFRVGGKYRIDFKQYEISNLGEFLEIVPDKKIVFSWCSSFDQPLTPDTKVTIDLFPDGNKTRLLLVHTGFKSESVRASHQGGWESGLTDFTNELQEGKLRMVRVFGAPVTKLYETCKDRMVKGEILENVPNKKIVFNWDSTQVTLCFDEEDDGGSSVELIHDHLNTKTLLKSHRAGWQKITEAMAETLGRSS